MSQYVFTMTSRMVAITATCLVLLCALLFVLGMQIGELIVTPPAAPSPVASAPVAPAQPAPATGAPAAGSASTNP